MKRIGLLLGLLALTSGGLLAQKVGYNFDRQADFSKYHTYRWVDIGDQGPIDSLTQKQIRSAIDDELAKKGLSKVEGDSSDLAVGFQASLSKEKQLSTIDTGWGYGPGWGRWYGYGGMGMGTSTTTTSTITVGTLAFDMYDAGSHNLVWRGIATKTVEPTSNPEKRQKKLAKAAEKLLKGYPPKDK